MVTYGNSYTEKLVHENSSEKKTVWIDAFLSMFLDAVNRQGRCREGDKIDWFCPILAPLLLAGFSAGFIKIAFTKQL